MRNEKTTIVTTAVAGMALVLFAGSLAPVDASEPGQWNFQLYAGWYLAGDLEDLNELPGDLPDTIEALGLEPGDDFTFGLRGGRRQSENWGWEVSVGYFDIDEASERLEDTGGVDITLWPFDLSFMYFPGGGNFYLYGGPGFATVDVNIDVNGVEVVDESSSNFSVNGGLGYMFNVGESAFIRIDGKLRYIDADFYSGETDGEVTLAIGWNFGG